MTIAEISEGARVAKYYFYDEIRAIQNGHIRALVVGLFDKAPNHYWTVPSSGSGKYHPEDESRERGQVLHTKRVVQLAMDLAESYGYAGIERDKLIAAALVHDLAKFGWDETPADRAVSGHEQLLIDATQETFHHFDHYGDVMGIARNHSGRWGPFNQFTDQTLANLGSLLHIADYLASRRHIVVNVEWPVIR